jgi:hypothetical protein
MGSSNAEVETSGVIADQYASGYLLVVDFAGRPNSSQEHRASIETQRVTACASTATCYCSPRTPRIAKKGSSAMRLNAPTQLFFIISLVFAGIALLSRIVVIQELTANSFVILLIGYVVLAVGCVFRKR